MLFLIPILLFIGFVVLDAVLWNIWSVYLLIPILSAEKVIFYIVIVLEIFLEFFSILRVAAMRKKMTVANNKKNLMQKKRNITVADVSKTIHAMESKRLESYLTRMKKRFGEYANLKAVLDSSLSMLFEEGQYTYATFSATISEMDAVIVRISISFITIFETFDEVDRKEDSSREKDYLLADIFGRLDEIGEIFDSVLTKLKTLLVQLAKLEHLSVEEFKNLGSVVELENLIKNTSLYKNI